GRADASVRALAASVAGAGVGVGCFDRGARDRRHRHRAAARLPHAALLRLRPVEPRHVLDAADRARLRSRAARGAADGWGAGRARLDSARCRAGFRSRAAPAPRAADAGAVTVSIRRAGDEDVDFLLDLVLHPDVEPFVGAVSAKDRRAVEAEVERSTREPHDFGRFVIEVDGDRAGAMGFELANRRSRVAHLERLAVHPSFRGRRLADEAAGQFQLHLVRDLGYHRLQLEIYGFNERALAHAERAGFVREGVRRRAYWRHGAWTDAVLFGLVADELDVPANI